MKVILGSRMLGVGALVLGAIVSSRAQATVTLAPASGSIYPTQSVAVSATVFSAPGLATGVHVLTVTGLPSGVTTNPAVLSYTLTLPIPVTTAVVNFQIVAGPSAVAASANVVVADASYGSGSFALTILEPRLHLAITTPAIALGGSTVNVPVGVSADPGFGFIVGAGGVPLQFGVDAGGPPANVTAGGTQNELPPYVTTLTFPFRRTGPVTSGTYVVPLTATWLGTKSSALTATASLTLTIPDIAVPDFTVAAVPPSLTLTPGSSGKITFTVTPSGGFSAPVTLAVPPNASVSAAPSTYTFPAAGGSVDVTFTASPNASAATIPITVSAAGGAGTPVSHTVSVTVVVQPPPADFNVRVSPPAPSVPAGRATPLSFVLDAVGSFAGSATLTAVQLPPGATLSPASLVLMPAIPQSASLAVPRATPAGTYTLVFRADEIPSAGARRSLLISKTVRVPLIVQSPVGGFTATVSPVAVLASPSQPVAVRYELHNLADTPLTITGDTFLLRSQGGAVLESVDEPFAITLPPSGTTVVSNTVLVTGEQFAKAGAPPVVLADRTFRAAPDATGYTDTATATTTVTAVNSLLSTASATRISVVYPPSGTLVGRGNSLRAQGLVIGSGTGNLFVGWFFDGILVETATVPLQNGTPTSVSNAISLPTLISGNHEISLAVLAPNTLSSPAVQIYVEEGEQTLRLVSPTAGAAFAPAFGAPTFSWIPVPGIARYGVGFRSLAPGAPWSWAYTTDTRWSPPASFWNSLAEGEYEWGVRGFTNTGRAVLDSQSGGASAPPTSESSPDMAGGWTVSSAQGRFSIGGSEASLQALEGRASAGDGAVTFAWKEIPGALYVHSLYEEGPGGLKRVRTEILNRPALLLPSAAMPPGGPFLWRVSAVDKEGRPLGAMALAAVPAAGNAP